MKQYLKNLFFFSLILTMAACSNSKQLVQSKDELSHSQKNSHQFKILGTKGSGEPPVFGYNEYEPNSRQSISNALEKVDGVEIDLQISSDSTLWLFEGEKIKDCRSLMQSFPAIDDIELGLASQCWHHFHLIPLDSLIRQIHALASAEKIISFDLSFLNQASTQKLFGGKEKAVKAVMNRLNKSLKGQPYQVLFEAPDVSLIPLIKKQTDFPVFLQLNATNKSDKLKRQNIVANIDILKTKDVKVKDLQIRGIKHIEDMFYAINHKANYIQTENIPLGSFFSKMSSQKLKDTVLYNEKLFGTDKEEDKLLIADLKPSDWKGSAVLQLTIDSIAKAGFTLTFVTSNANGDELSRNGIGISPDIENYWHFLNADKLEEKQCARLKIYILNQNKLNFRFKNLRLNKKNY